VYCVVPVARAGSLALAELAGEPLLLRALSAVSAAGLDPVVVTDDLASVRPVLRDAAPLVGIADLAASVGQSGTTLLVHDPLCPLTPPSLLVSMSGRGADGAAAVAVLAMTDTVKTTTGDLVTATINRAAVAAVASPFVGPTELVLRAAGTVLDLPGLVRRLWGLVPIGLVAADALCARVSEASELELLSSVHQVGVVRAGAARRAGRPRT
jgi:2-C-methyl-D-erythritol 4-phosphate cytidylyltransferase